MKISRSSHQLVNQNLRNLIVVTAVSLLAGLLSCNTGPQEATPPATQTPTAQASPSPTPQDAETQRRQQWETDIAKVPVPKKGSSTVSPTKLNIRMSRSANSSGYGAG